MSSTISAARAVLYERLRTNNTLSQVEVTFGNPAGHAENEIVSMGGVETVTETQATQGGNKGRDERYVLLVELQVIDAAGTATEVDARGFELYEAVRATVLADRTLDGVLTGLGAEVADLETEGTQPMEGGGWFMLATVRVLCRTRIT